MNIFASIRERIGSAVGAVIGAVFMLGCGALLAFVLSPQQALEARRIDKMPLMDAGSVAEAAAGAVVGAEDLAGDEVGLALDLLRQMVHLNRKQTC